MTSKPARPAEIPVPLDLYQAVADDMRVYHRLSQPKTDYARAENRAWVPVDDHAAARRIPAKHARDSFPPRNLVGAKTAADVINELMFAFERLQERPRELLGLEGADALAKIISIPRVTADVISDLASGAKQLGSGLGSEIDRIFGLEKQLAKFSVKANTPDPTIADLPFKMDALPYTGRLPDHGQLLHDMFAHHKTHAGQLAQSLRITGLNAEIIQYVSLYHTERDLFDEHAPEPVFGWAISRKLDQDIFSMENGPFLHYCAARMAIQHKPDPFKPGQMLADPIAVYDYPVTDRFTYAETYRTDALRPNITERQKNLTGKRDTFFDNLNTLTRGALGDAADLVALGISYPGAIGHKKLSGKDKAIVEQNATLQQAGIDAVDQAALASQEFLTVEQRRDFRSFSTIRKDWVFANQAGRGTKAFAVAFAQAMAHIHENLADIDGLNPDTALGGTFYPIAAKTRQKSGAPTFYVATPVVDSMINNGLLIARQRSDKYGDYVNRAIPA